MERIEKKQAVGKVVVTDKNGNLIAEISEVVEEVIADEPMANVGVKLGLTINRGDYESLRVDVSLYMPSETDKDSLDQTFKKTHKWVEKKLNKVVKENQ